jgi:4a-hydroxytetrahydrobiopterin dehydratase
MDNLASKKCVPCEGGMPALTPEEVKEYISQTPDWEVFNNKKIG